MKQLFPFTHLALGAFLAVTTSSLAFADNNPSLMAKDIGGDERAEKPLNLDSLDVKIVKAGGVIQTDIIAVFSGSDVDADEAEFLFEMPKGALVNGYGLDIDGHLVDGVLTEKERAEKAYTDKVTAGIDPGIAEVVSGNVYKTRVFPIEENRTIKLSFATPLDQDFVLPFNPAGTVKSATFTVPLSETGLIDASALTADGVGHYTLMDGKLDVAVNIPKDVTPMSLSRHSAGQVFAMATIDPPQSAEFDPQNVRIYWDHSLSRKDQDVAAERGILRRLMSELSPGKVELITGQDRVTSRSDYAAEDFGRLDSALRELDYDSGSNLKALLGATDERADMCIVVTDGQATIGGADIADMPCPVFALTTAKDANFSFLNSLAAKTGGHAVSNTASRSAAVNALSQSPGLRVASSNFGDVQRLSLGGQEVFIAPVSQSRRKSFDIDLISWDGQTVRASQSLRSIPVIESNGPGTFWAAGMAEAMRSDPATSYADIVAFSRPYSLAGKESALIVLEEAGDYIEAGITPPDNFPADLMTDYKEDLADHQKEKAEAQAERMDEMIDLWEEQIEWWETDFAALKREEMEKKADMDALGEREANDVLANAPPAPMVAHSPRPEEAARFGEADDGTSEEVIVTASRRKKSIDIAIREWTPDRPYLKALGAADEADLEKTYRAQRRSYGDLPAFYLEVADFYYRKGLTERAGQIVLGALELPSANAETQTVVAHRLSQYGDLDRAIELYELAAKSSVERPQPFHHLGMAYAQRAEKSGSSADYLRALENFNHIIETVWDGDDDGIEVIALHDANAVIARAPSRVKRKSPLHKKLTKNLPVDTRIIMDWTSDNADMDLWVHEPSGEKVFYSNPESEMGGQLSNDMTNGYGPEQYVLRRAPEGEFTVSAKYYSSSAYDPNGAVAVRARVFRNFGKNDQTMETIIMEFTDDQQEVYEIGTVSVKNPE